MKARERVDEVFGEVDVVALMWFTEDCLFNATCPNLDSGNELFLTCQKGAEGKCGSHPPP